MHTCIFPMSNVPKPTTIRTTNNKTKMDRYTDDLKDSLRHKLANSVGNVQLRTDDILARSHRQIVADFTDPRQWYYSATHNYLINLLRESQRQTDGYRIVSDGKMTSGSRQKGRNLISRSTSSHSSASGEMHRKKKASILVLPTETKRDLANIRGTVRRRPDEGRSKNEDFLKRKGDISDHNKLHMADDEQKIHSSGGSKRESASNVLKDNNDISLGVDSKAINELKPNRRSSSNSDTHVDDINTGARKASHVSFVNNSNSHENNALAHTGENNNTVVDLEGYHNTFADRSCSENSTASEEYNKIAMQAYMSSKHIRRDSDGHVRRKGKTRMKSQPNFLSVNDRFLPLKKRADNCDKHTGDVNLPLIGFPMQKTDENASTIHPTGFRAKRVRPHIRKNKVDVVSSDEQVSEKVVDVPYVEGWITRLGVSGRHQEVSAHDKPDKPIERPDNTNLHFHQSHRNAPSLSRQLQNLSLPDDFQPVGQFQPFQPLTSLYLYSMKQKSDLKVKLQYLHFPKPIRSDDVTSSNSDEQDRKNHDTFETKLKQARSKVDRIENKLGELYQAETGLRRIIGREGMKPPEKPVIEGAKMTIQTKSASAKNSQFRNVTKPDRDGVLQEAYSLTTQRQSELENQNEDPDMLTVRNFDDMNKMSDKYTSPLSGESSAKLNVLSLSFCTENPDENRKQEITITTTRDPVGNEISRSVDAYRATSTSPWTGSGADHGKSVPKEAITVKTIQVFDDNGKQNSNSGDIEVGRMNESMNNNQQTRRDVSMLDYSNDVRDSTLAHFRQNVKIDINSDLDKNLGINEEKAMRGHMSSDKVTNEMKLTEGTDTPPPNVYRCPFCEVPHESDDATGRNGDSTNSDQAKNFSSHTTAVDVDVCDV